MSTKHSTVTRWDRLVCWFYGHAWVRHADTGKYSSCIRCLKAYRRNRTQARLRFWGFTLSISTAIALLTVAVNPLTAHPLEFVGYVGAIWALGFLWLMGIEVREAE